MSIFKLFGKQTNNTTVKTDKCDNSNRQIEKLQKAKEEFAKSGNIEKVISVYESILLNSENSWNDYNYKILLADYYIKAGRNNDSWTVLNNLIIEYPNEIYRTRRTQYKQLKKEKNYLEALRMLSFASYGECYDMIGFKMSYLDKFIKDALIIAKKINISEESIYDLSNRIGNCVIKGNKKFNENLIKEQFNEWYKALPKVVN